MLTTSTTHSRHRSLIRSYPNPGSHGADEEEEVEEEVDEESYEKLEAEFGFPMQKHPRQGGSSCNLQAISEARKRVMELAGEMPEESSSFELSLKDIVSELTVSPSRAVTEGDRVEVVKGGSFHFATEKQSKGEKQSMKKKKKTAAIKPREVPRSYSVHGGTFLIKMFSPSPLISSRKINPKCSRLSSKEGSSHGSSGTTTSRSSSCSSSGCSSSSTTRLRKQSVTSSSSLLGCLTCLPPLCGGGKQRSRECMF